MSRAESSGLEARRGEVSVVAAVVAVAVVAIVVAIVTFDGHGGRLQVRLAYLLLHLQLHLHLHAYLPLCTRSHAQYSYKEV